MTTTAEKIRIDSEHRYWIGDKTVPGFTEIARSIGVIKDNKFYTVAGREEGTALHLWTHFLARCNEPTEEADPRILGRVQAFRKFMFESGFKFVGGEEPQYEPVLQYACTPDLWGNIGSFSVVIDVKGGAKEKWHALQLIAQKIALAANGFHAQKRYALYLSDSGYRLVPYEEIADEYRWKAILAAYFSKQFYA